MNATGAAILTNPAPQGHLVYPYTNESQLCDAVSLFAGSGLHQGGSVLLMMQDTHRHAMRHQLRVDGINVAELEASGRLVCRAAEGLMGTFLFDGIIDDGRFKNTVGLLIESAQAASSNGEVRVFSQMVDLLWISNPIATERLEELWNQVIKIHSVSLLCAYSLGGSRPEALPTSLIGHHSVALP